MNKSEVYENLCFRDKRNPIHIDVFDDDEDAPIPRVDCFCDNCFHGRDKLALEILKCHSLQSNYTDTRPKGSNND